MYPHVKRAADFSIATMLLIILMPVGVIVAIVIKLTSEGPIFFVQQRYGRNKLPFAMYKFRSMVTDAPRDCPTGDLENPESHITPAGRLLRKTSIDELPQLLNVIIGDMSLIGPRPVILAETELIAERDRYNANSRQPGITGWAQANGRDQVTISEKARLDGEYAVNFGLVMDFYCLIKTVETIVFAKGYHEGVKEVITQHERTQRPAFYSRVYSNTKAAIRPVQRGRSSVSVTQAINDIDI